MVMLESILEAVRNTVHSAEFCFMITHDRKGHANCRWMQPFEPGEDLLVHFGASTGSRKVLEIQSYENVVLAYDDKDEMAYVTMKGTASVSNDPELKKRYWRPSFFEFWPEGPGSDNYVVIKFVPDQIEVMNFKKQIVPEPYGLKPAIIARQGDSWRIMYPPT